MWRKLFIVFVAGLIMVFFFESISYNGGYSLDSITRSRLNVLTELANVSREHGFRFTDSTKISELLGYALKHGFISKGVVNSTDLSLDGWGKEVRLMVLRQTKNQEIIFISAGPNGIQENGQGDDIAYRVVLKR